MEFNLNVFHEIDISSLVDERIVAVSRTKIERGGLTSTFVLSDNLQFSYSRSRRKHSRTEGKNIKTTKERYVRATCLRTSLI